MTIPSGTTTLTAPQLYLSGADLGWNGLDAQAFYEPAEYAGWISPASPDVTVILFAGGTMRMEQRAAQGPWRAQLVRHQDVILNTPTRVTTEVRWRVLTPALPRTLHLRLSQAQLARTAAEVTGHEWSSLALRSQIGVRDPLLAQLGMTLWHELAAQSPAGRLYAETAAQLLAVHLLRHYAAVDLTSKNPTHGLTARQLRHITECALAHLDGDLSLDFLARQIGYSPYHFARLFHQTTGDSPHQFVLRLRLERAQCLLRERDLPLAQVALASGFANQSHLTRAFKRALGLTPRAYRREYGDGATFD